MLNMEIDEEMTGREEARLAKFEFSRFPFT